MTATPFFQYTFALQRWKFCKKMALFHWLQSCLCCDKKQIFIFLTNVKNNNFLTLQIGLHERRYNYSPFSKEKKRKEKLKENTKIQQLPFMFEFFQKNMIKFEQRIKKKSSSALASMHYAEVGDIHHGLGLPGKACL